MKKALKIVGIALVVLVVGVFAAIQVMKSKAKSRLERTWADVKGVDVAVPWPLSPAEIDALREEKKKKLAPVPAAAGEAEAAAVDPLAGVDLTVIARERALARGKHLIETRLGCTECHGEDFAGKVIIDAPPMGVWAGPNITVGGNAKDMKPSDWDRIVRHGIARDGTSTTMPAIDFTTLSDQELSDIITYVTAQPASDKKNVEDVMGPIRGMLIATGGIPVSAEIIDHAAARPQVPPAAAVNLEFGKHIAQSCVGCHRMDYSGGKVPGGHPAWPAAGNLTPDATGLKGWTAEDFRRALREGKSKDGRELQDPMKTGVVAFKKMSDTELDAAFAYLQSLPPLPKGQ